MNKEVKDVVAFFQRDPVAFSHSHLLASDRGEEERMRKWAETGVYIPMSI